jgi:hypothetical protein
MKKILSRLVWFMVLALMFIGAANAVIVTFENDRAFGLLALVAACPTVVYVFKKGKAKLFDNQS